MVRVTGLDHIVLVVADVERSLEWYRSALGLPGERIDEWRAGRVPFPSVRISDDTIIDLVARGGPVAGGAAQDGPGPKNLHHFCLVVEPADLSEHGQPVTRFGARGNGTSVYIEDPDGNVVELRYYQPVTADQPAP